MQQQQRLPKNGDDDGDDDRRFWPRMEWRGLKQKGDEKSNVSKSSVFKIHEYAKFFRKPNITKRKEKKKKKKLRKIYCSHNVYIRHSLSLSPGVWVWVSFGKCMCVWSQFKNVQISLTCVLGHAPINRKRLIFFTFFLCCLPAPPPLRKLYNLVLPQADMSSAFMHTMHSLYIPCHSNPCCWLGIVVIFVVKSFVPHTLIHICMLCACMYYIVSNPKSRVERCCCNGILAVVGNRNYSICVWGCLCVCVEWLETCSRNMCNEIEGIECERKITHHDTNSTFP